MEKINLFKNLIRLSVIAEELQETDPEASELIDDTIKDVADTFPENNNVGDENFPPIPTPATTDELPTHTQSEYNSETPETGGNAMDVNVISDKIVSDLLSNLNFEQLLQSIEQGQESPEILKGFIREKINDELGANQNSAY